MEEKEILVKNVKSCYKRLGSGKPFLILHGWGSASDRWIDVGERLAEKGFLVIIPDLPGFGKSERPAAVWGTDSYVDWLKEFCEKLPELSGDFCLLGHSFGGAMAVKFTVNNNQKVKKLFLVAANVIRTVTIKKQLLPKVSKMFKMFAVLPFYQLARKAFYKYVVGGYDYLNVEKTMKETFLRVISEDLSHHLPFIRVPTVIIWGDRDSLTPVANAEIMSKKIENSKLIIVKGQKHALQISSPDILAGHILAEFKQT